MSKKFDFLLFGVTGFTGKLVAEYFFEKGYAVKWAASARNEARGTAVLNAIAEKFQKEPPPLLVADLVCETPEQEDVLRSCVKQAKIVLSCSGPFEKYGQTLVKICVEEGVHYADITGETDFFRKMISEHHLQAQETGATIICHCGNDCIPQDLAVYEMNRHIAAKAGGPYRLKEVRTYVETAEDATWSGGTAATAKFQLSKDRTTEKPSFDPLLLTPTGDKSEYKIKNVSPKQSTNVADMPGKTAVPWVMGPVMVNCVRRSNALLHYNKELAYGDAMLTQPSISGWLKQTWAATLLTGSVMLPSVFQYIVPGPGEGPPREHMEEGFMTIHAFGTFVDGEDRESKISAKFHFNKDTAYLYTAAMLVEAGMTMLHKSNALAGGVTTPAASLGHDLTERILKEMDVSLDIVEGHVSTGTAE